MLNKKKTHHIKKNSDSEIKMTIYEDFFEFPVFTVVGALGELGFGEKQ